MAPIETEVEVRHGTLRVREAGDPRGPAIVYFHGTPGSRLDLRFGDEVVTQVGIRLVTFDRPGYGGSPAAPFSLASIAADTRDLADHLGLERFATLGLSGGGPFALAAATITDARVSKVGVASGAGPFEHVSGALEMLDDNDSEAYAKFPDAQSAAEGFAKGFEPLRELLLQGDDSLVVHAFWQRLSSRDRTLIEDPEIGALLIASLREGLGKGVDGGGWDNAAWIGKWDVDISLVECPVFLWYGEEDLFAPPAHGLWLREHLKDPRFTLRASEGHFGLIDHFTEVMAAMTQD